MHRLQGADITDVKQVYHKQDIVENISAANSISHSCGFYPARLPLIYQLGHPNSYIPSNRKDVTHHYILLHPFHLGGAELSRAEQAAGDEYLRVRACVRKSENMRFISNKC